MDGSTHNFDFADWAPQMNSEVVYRERIWPGVGLPGFLLFMGVSLAIAFQRAYQGKVGLIITIASALLASAVTFASAPMLEISSSELRLGKARIARSYLGKVAILNADQTQHALGPGAHAGALTVTRSGIKATVLVEILDENDPHPYWMFSTRGPLLVLEAMASRTGKSAA